MRNLWDKIEGYTPDNPVFSGNARIAATCRCNLFGDTSQQNPIASGAAGEAGGTYVNNAQIVFGNGVEFGAVEASTTPTQTVVPTSTSGSAANSPSGVDLPPATATATSSGSLTLLLLIGGVVIVGALAIFLINKKKS